MIARRAAVLLLSPVLALTLVQAGAEAGGRPTEEDVREAFASIAGQDLPECDDALDAESCTAELTNINHDNQVFCQRLDDAAPQTEVRCEYYWPFVNPTIHPELAPSQAFTYDASLADRLQVQIDQRDLLVTRLDGKLADAKAKIKKLRKRLQEAQQS